jgi:hypothetical protein
MGRGHATFLESQCFMPSREYGDFTTIYVGTDALIRRGERSSTWFLPASRNREQKPGSEAAVRKRAEPCSAGPTRASVPTWFVVEIAESAGELIAGQLQPVKIAEDRNRN